MPASNRSGSSARITRTRGATAYVSLEPCAHRLGLQVIGQAVEDPQAAAALWVGGIDYIQGNLVQRPEQALDFDFRSATL